MRPDPDALARAWWRPQDGALPVDPAALFGRRAPLAVEVGFGGGEFLAGWAAERSDWDFVGFENHPDCVVRASRALANAGVGNARLVLGDARTLLGEVFAPGSLRRVLMQFPMPWPKGRHAKHRIGGPRLAATLADVLEEGGAFELVTDQDWFAADAAAALQEHGGFRVPALERDPPRPRRTRYERKWARQGRSTWRLEATLLAPRRARRILRPEAMETLRLDVPPSGERLRALRGRRARAGDCVCEVKEAWEGPRGWLVRVVSADGDFAQIYHLHLRLRRDGSALLAVGDVPRPFYTEAVRFTQRAVRNMLDDQSG